MRDQPLVLVAEHDGSFLEPLASGLRREGLGVEVAQDGRAALRAFEDVRPDIVLVDVDLPRLSGLEVCRAIRARASTPVILVTTRRADVDVVGGLEVGADDFVATPHRTRELVARVRAVLRRSAVEPPVVDDEGDVIGIGDVTVDTAGRLVVVRGEVVRLPTKQFDLLALLVRNAGRVLPRGMLLDRVWGPGYRGDPKTLDVHVKRVRGHVEEDPAHPVRIVTVRGVGYRFERNGA